MKVSKVLFMLLFAIVVLSGCGAIKTIFEAGMWWAFFLVAVVIILIVFIASKFRKKD